jgi:hypothetical protein
MAIFSVAFSFCENLGGGLDRLRPSCRWTLKTLDKPTSQAKIPPISGKLHLSLGRPTVIARAYDFNPAVATPREEKHP